ncbi:MAG: AAA family ATPase [Comamonadaceae bacterium]|nr:AAA family ATPase [Comamonadaceae bacterium]
MSTFIAPNFTNIPAELRALPRWVTWRAEGATGEKPSKVPYAADRPRTRASSTDPSTWGTFQQAEASFLEGDRTGVGFVLNGDGLVGVDIDHCVTDGLPDPVALAMLDQLGAAYVEMSPSGTGLRAFGYAENLPSGCKGQYNGLEVELYSTSRYLTLTGQPIKTGPLTKLNSFDALADHLRADRKVDSATGMVTQVEPTEKQGALLQRVLSGDVYHDSLRDLAASLVATGMHPGAVVNHLRALMDSSAGAHDDRWAARRNQISDLVNSASKKFTSGSNGTIDSQTGEILASSTGQQGGFEFVIAGQLLIPKPVVFLIDEMIETDCVAMVFGASGSGKSFLAIDWSCSVATGTPWLDRDVKQGSVFYLQTT